MFKNKKNRRQKMVDTIISSETIIEGKITHPTSIRIDGKVYGEIECAGDVYIGKTGYVEPSIQAKNILLAGEVNGDIHAFEKVHIQPSGKLTGRSTTKGMVIDEGGTFNGESRIIEGDEQPQINIIDTEAIQE